MASYTRFTGISSVTDGYSVGPVGSEVAVITGTVTSAVTAVFANATITSATVTSLNASNILSGTKSAVQAFFTLSSAAQTVYVVMPFAGNITAGYVASDTSAISSAYTITQGSAGSTALSVTQTSGIAGLVSTMTLGTVAVTAGQSFGCLRAAQGTTSASTVTIVVQRTS